MDPSRAIEHLDPNLAVGWARLQVGADIVAPRLVQPRPEIARCFAC